MTEVLTATGWTIVYVVFYLIMLAGVVVIPLGIPGQFIVAGAALIFSLSTGWHRLPWWSVLILFGLACLAEIIEGIAGFLGAKQAKGSIWSSFGALGGGIVGAIVGSGFLPLIGTLVGALVGTFGGAYLVEYYRTQSHEGSGQVAKGALIGRIVGSVSKVLISLVMIVIVTFLLLTREPRPTPHAPARPANQPVGESAPAPQQALPRLGRGVANAGRPE